MSKLKSILLILLLISTQTVMKAQDDRLTLGVRAGHNNVFGTFAAFSLETEQTFCEDFSVRGGLQYNTIGRTALEAHPAYNTLLMKAGSGPNFRPNGLRKSLTLEPITPGWSVTVIPSSSVLIFPQFLPATTSTESLTACPERLVPAALNVTETLWQEAALRICAISSSVPERITT